MSGDAITRWTVRLALLFFAGTVALRLAGPSARRTARTLWTAGCLLFLAHVAAAFQFVHGWSHAHAFDATARQTGEMFGVYSGAGLYLNYLFTLLWVADVVWWWRGIETYERRPRGVDIALHAFMLFMAFNGAVVFARGPARYVAAGVFALLMLLAVWRTRRRPAAASV